MGIPVWVSRDRVSVELKETSDNVHGNEADGHSASKIIQDLEQNVKPVSKQQQTQEPTNQLEKEVSETTKLKVEELPNFIGETDIHLVFAQGNLEADWLVIGESPESCSALSDQPFPADAGILLDNMLKAVGLESPRKQAYLINTVLKPNAKTRSAQSSQHLHELLSKSIEQINPKIVLLMGQFSAQTLLKSKEPLVRLRGKIHQPETFKAQFIVTYYPDYLLSKPIDKRKAWEDLKLAMRSQR